MARTGETNIKIRNNGVQLGNAFNTIDLLAGIVGADVGSGVVSFTGATITGSNVATDVVAAATSGADVTLDLTTLSHAFVAVEVVFRNGQALVPTSDWTLLGSVITVTNAVATDQYMVQYTW
jgi:uncharacterized membrane protein YeaQ/YmgE (transglycosylase-associated protein family)